MAVCFNPKPTTYMPDRPPVLDPFLAVKNLGLKCLSRADSSVSPPPSGETCQGSLMLLLSLWMTAATTTPP
ncbi:hypothetical protein F383_03209 [Gossypium arboreum]|uniref:Uncharacterized protein n=1 Tax=Gossypium arboreum TaxID=29729 RepID=A0A0B0NZX9_GOSAR|nr:hypothetical protein F383_03209 [Gossypium arboreum]